MTRLFVLLVAGCVLFLATTDVSADFVDPFAEEPKTELDRYVEGVEFFERIIAKRNWHTWEHLVELANECMRREHVLKKGHMFRYKWEFELTITGVRGWDRNYPGNFAEAALVLSRCRKGKLTD